MSILVHDLPADHSDRLSFAFDSLEGLSIGDAFGQQFFTFPEWILPRTLPVGPWRWTDDTAMAIGILDVLQRCGQIDQDELAETFSANYAAEPHRGYGGMAHEILMAIGRGGLWRKASAAAFDGEGSMGNGAAMRVAPVGAYFADDLERVVKEAALSAEVTHAHPDGIAGAIAIGIAAAVATRGRGLRIDVVRDDFWEAVLEFTPDGPTRRGIIKASQLPAESHVDIAAGRLGSGDGVIASDTVPFCLWNASRHLDNYEEALWETVLGLGDRDTTCAIVGGIVSCFTGRDGVPPLWRLEREALPISRRLI